MSMNPARFGFREIPEYTTTVLRESQHRIAVVIPVINEDGRLLAQLRAMESLATAFDVIVADGGSTDGSTNPERLKQLGVTALLTKIGPGKLSSQLRMAFGYCLDAGYEAVITIDGNGKDDVSGIPRVREALFAGYDFIQGSRFTRGGEAVNTPALRYLAIRFVHAPLTSMGACHWYTDSTNGFRGFSRRLLEDPQMDIFRNVFDTYELLAYFPIRSARLGFKVSEVPVTRRYPANAPTPTKIHGLGSQIALLKILVKAVLGGYSPRTLSD